MNEDAPRRFQKQRDWLRRDPFFRLVAHFIQRMFAGEDSSDSSEGGIGIGAVLGLLALPGGFVSLLLLDKYSSLLRFLRRNFTFDAYAVSLPDKYFFIVFSMVVTGIVTVLKWDRIFPDRRDFANLAPLPIATRKIFLANLLAVLFLAVVFAVDINAASSVLFPLFVTAERPHLTEFLNFAVVHAAIVVLASLFTFFGFFSLMGVLMIALRNSVFRKISLPIRVASVIGLVATMCTSFAVPAFIQDLPRHPESWIRFLPPVWFAAQYQTWQGRGTDPLPSLGAIGLRAVPCLILVALIVYAVAYRRYFIRIPESLGTNVHGGSGRTWRIPLVDRLLLASPFQRACYWFAWKTLARSEGHCLLLGGFAGAGFVLASQAALLANQESRGIGTLPSAVLLSIPLTICYFTITGLRFVFDIPVEHRANWIFRAIVDERTLESAAVARKLLLSVVVPALVCVVTPFMIYGWGWTAALEQLALSLALCVLLVEVLLLDFRKIPFSCSYPPLGNRAVVALVVYFIGYLLFATGGSEMEHWILLKPIRLLWTPIWAAAIWFGLTVYRREVLESAENLVFDERVAEEIRVLGLMR
jgi:hypothetical protein